MLALRKTQQTRTDPESRRNWKFRLIKSLYDRSLDGEQIRLLFKFLDWMMELPAELEEALGKDLAAFEKERAMPYVSSLERIAEQKGEAKAKVEMLLHALAKRFGRALPGDLQARIQATADLAQLDAWFDMSLEADDLETFRRLAGI